MSAPGLVARSGWVAGAEGWRFGAACAAFVGLAAALAGGLPLALSLAAVFLCAGPHNWVEARYFLARLPGRWGRLRPYFVLGLGGVAGLTTAFAGLPWLLGTAGAAGWWPTALAVWNTALTLWVAGLVELRSRQNPRRDWGWVWPAAFGVIALAWLAPLAWDLALVYLHPLVALWILDREVRRSRPRWRPAYHAALVCVPLGLAGLCWRLADAPPLPGDDGLTLRVTHHAGADLLRGVSSHLLVAVHAFLEVVHYGVWLLAVPWCARGSALWRLERAPLARRSAGWARLVRGVTLAGLALVVALWLAFLIDYPVTRDVYFTLALAHVLAEVPFLLRAL